MRVSLWEAMSRSVELISFSRGNCVKKTTARVEECCIMKSWLKDCFTNIETSHRESNRVTSKGGVKTSQLKKNQIKVKLVIKMQERWIEK